MKIIERPECPSVRIIFKLDPPLAFGLFAMGCSPGGAASNIYTHLLDGDVSLSVTMTFVSTICSLGIHKAFI
jgi:sodium/bile acid cotransporter 3/5